MIYQPFNIPQKITSGHDFYRDYRIRILVLMMLHRYREMYGATNPTYKRWCSQYMQLPLLER